MTWMNHFDEIIPKVGRKATTWEKIVCWFWGHYEGLPREKDFQWCQRCNRRWQKRKEK